MTMPDPIKLLEAIEKNQLALNADDSAKQAAIKKSFASFKKAAGAAVIDETLNGGGAGGMDPALAAMLGGDVTIDVNKGAGAATVEDPIEATLLAMHDAVAAANPAFAKSVEGTAALQVIFNKGYQILGAQREADIDQTVAAAAEHFTKTGKTVKKPADEDPDAMDDDAIEKMFSTGGVPNGIIKKMATLQTEVAAMRHDKELGIFQKRAVALHEPETFGTDLHLLHTYDPALGARIEKMLSSKNELIRKGNLWGAELGAGTGTVGGGEPLLALNAKAEEIRKSAAGANLSFQQAFTKACTENPDLYDQHKRSSN